MLEDQLGVLAPVRSVLGQFTHGQGCTVTLKGLSLISRTTKASGETSYLLRPPPLGCFRGRRLILWRRF